MMMRGRLYDRHDVVSSYTGCSVIVLFRQLRSYRLSSEWTEAMTLTLGSDGMCVQKKMQIRGIKVCTVFESKPH